MFLLLLTSEVIVAVCNGKMRICDDLSSSNVK